MCYQYFGLFAQDYPQDIGSAGRFQSVWKFFNFGFALILELTNRMTAPCDQSQATKISLDAYLDGIKNLPPTPTVLIKLINLFRQPHADVDDIVQLLQRDPALAAEILRRCNSSFFGDGSAIKDVNEAVYRLGFYEVYKTAEKGSVPSPTWRIQAVKTCKCLQISGHMF
jgi:hypothetical protein